MPSFTTEWCLVVYFLCGLRRDNLAASFLQWIGSTIMQGFSMLALAVLMGSLTRNLAEASTIGQGIAMIYMLTGGVSHRSLLSIAHIYACN